jgi:radical SAM superfamily enzyme YgiQ (UPF0313 family)
MNFLLLNLTEGVQNFPSNPINFSGPSLIPPLGLLYVAKSLEEEGHTVEVIDFYCEKDAEEKIKKSLPNLDAIGICVYTSNIAEAAKTSEMVKDIDQDISIIIGGPHCIYLPNKALIDIPMADICINGEAEQVIKDIPTVIQGYKDISKLPGVYFRKNNEIKHGKKAEVIKDLDTISFPARYLVEKYDYGKINNVILFKQKFTTFISSRGCPYRCKFCSRHVPTIETYRKRSIENVEKELQQINEKYSSVMIADDNFLADSKRAIKIMEDLVEIGTDLDIYILGARVDSANKELYKKMNKAGVKFIQFGIETGNQDVLDFYNKKITLRQIRKALNLSNKMNFMTSGTFILGAPIETKKHINNTIKFACSLPLDFAYFYQLSYQLQSDLWREAVKEGKIDIDDGFSIIADKKRGLGNFTSEELEEFTKKAFKRFYLRPSYVARQFYKSIGRKDFTIFKIGLSFI